MQILRDDLFGALSDFARWLQPYSGRVAVIGGIAAVFLGRPRVTRDIDALFWIGDEEIEPLLQSGAAFGWEPRLPDALEFAFQNRVLLVRHTRTQIEADLSLGMLSFEEAAIQNALWRDIGGFSIPLPRAEDLVVMKLIAGRPRDIADVEGVLANTPNFNREHVRLIVREFAQLLEAPEILDNLNRLLP